MSEYNIQMNKYNALNAEYDKLYPQPMKHASTHAKDGSDPITPASIGAADASVLGQTIKVSGEVGVDGYTVVYATLCLKKLTGTKCDLYISYRIESNTQNSNYFDFISYSKICSLLGIKSFSGTPNDSQVILEDSVLLSGSDLTIVSPLLNDVSGGYTGIRAILTGEGYLQLGRYYTVDYNFGSWELNRSIFTPGTYGQINFYGVDYSI